MGHMPRSEETPHSRAELDSGLNILFLAAFPLLAWFFQGSFADIATALVELWLLTIALRMIAKGKQLQREYEATPGARAPRLPRKLIGSVLVGVMVMVLAGHQFNNLFMPLLFGGIAIGLSIAAFGIDPMRHRFDGNAKEERRQLDARHAAELQLEQADYALAQIADRAAMLEDAEITRRTEAARSLVMRLLRSFARDPDSLMRLKKPVSKFVKLLDAEAERLCMAVSTESSTFARRRYIAKLEVMTESFEASARKTRVRGDKDAFEVEADLLLNRMPRNSAA